MFIYGLLYSLCVSGGSSGSWLEELRDAIRRTYEAYVVVRSWRYPSRRGVESPGSRSAPTYTIYGIETFILLDVGTLSPDILLGVASEIASVMEKYSTGFTIIQFADDVKRVDKLGRRVSKPLRLDISSYPVSSSAVDPALREVLRRSCIQAPGKGRDAVFLVTSGSLQASSESARLADRRLPSCTGLRAVLYTEQLSEELFNKWIKLRIS